MDQPVSFFFTFEAQCQTQPDKLLTPALAEGQKEFHLHSTGFEVPNSVFCLGEIFSNLNLISTKDFLVKKMARIPQISKNCFPNFHIFMISSSR